MARTPRLHAELVSKLEGIRSRFGAEALESDPVRYVHRYTAPEDQEIVAYLASALAFGRVASIFKSLDRLFEALGPSPSGLARSASPRALQERLGDFRHRWVSADVMADAIHVLGAMLRERGSLEEWFVPDWGALDLRSGIERFANAARDRARRADARGFRFLFSDLRSGGACKRLNLFLRWVVRPKDGVDLGLWRRIHPAQLTIPLDVHIGFLGRVLGLTSRRTPGWRMARDITDALRALDPRDPVKYDWSLSRLGILGHCPERRSPVSCPPCPLFQHCRLGQGRMDRRLEIA